MNFKKYKLEDAVDILTGFPFSGSKYDDSTGTRVVRGENVTIGELRWDTIKYWKEPFPEFEKYELKNGDIVIGMDGSRVGKNRAQIRSNQLPLLLAQRVARLRANETFDQNYIAYVIKSESFEKYVDSIKTGTSIPHISSQQIKNFEFQAPELPTQRRIAAILTALDDKIELNRRMNETLEGIAQAIWEEWFGKYANGEEELPEGWSQGTIFEIADLIGGGTPKTEVQSYWFGDIPWISAKDITPNNRQFIIETDKNISFEGLNNSSAKLLPAYSTVVSARGTVGNYCLIPKEMTISQSNYAIKSKLECADFYLFLQIGNMIEEMKQKAYGTVFDTITTKTFSEIEIIIPSLKTIQKFENLITPIFETRLKCLTESQLLRQIRDSLLPKLMTGEIEINTNELA